jgi:hypothetical protein
MLSDNEVLRYVCALIGTSTPEMAHNRKRCMARLTSAAPPTRLPPAPPESPATLLHPLACMVRNWDDRWVRLPP